MEGNLFGVLVFLTSLFPKYWPLCKLKPCGGYRSVNQTPVCLADCASSGREALVAGYRAVRFAAGITAVIGIVALPSLFDAIKLML